MKNLVALMLLVALTACGGGAATQTDAVAEVPIPEDAIPFIYNRHLYFDVEVCDSIAARMIFDTGNTHILFDETFYKEQIGDRVPLMRSMLGGVGDGKEAARLAMHAWRYRVGEEEMTEPMAIVMNLRNIVGDEADGMFGMQFMQNRRVEFDYADRYIRLLAPTDTIPADYRRIPCTWLDETKTRIILPLDVTFGDGYTYKGRFLVDTGMPGTLSFNTHTTDRLRGEQHLSDVKKISYEVGGIGGKRSEYEFKVERVTMGGFALNGVRVSLSDNEQGSLANTAYDGLVGNELLARFDVLFDFAECAIYLRKNRDFDAPQPAYHGVALKPLADHWVVNGLMEDGNAERAGLRRGDRVEKINGFTPAQVGPSTFAVMPDRLVLTVRRGGELIEIAVDKE